MRRILSRIGIVAIASAAMFPGLAAQETAAVFQGKIAEDFLLKAKVVSSRPLGEGVTRPYLVELELNGLTHRAIFKSIDVRKPGVTMLPDGSADIDFQDSWQTEIAAYTIDRIIGMGLVPATVERRVVDGKVGSLQWFVESMGTEAERLEKGLNPPDMNDWNEQIMTTRLFDEVDRHLKNILVTKEFKLRLIDHSRSLRINGSLKKPELLTRFSRRCSRA